MVSRGMDSTMAWVCVGLRWTSRRLSELLVFRLGLDPRSPARWPSRVCDPRIRMFCAPYTDRWLRPLTFTTLTFPSSRR